MWVMWPDLIRRTVVNYGTEVRHIDLTDCSIRDGTYDQYLSAMRAEAERHCPEPTGSAAPVSV